MHDASPPKAQESEASLQFMVGCPERYEIKALLGKGGMGIVVRARDNELNRDVAIKALLFEASSARDSQERFLKEAKALAILNHPNIIQIYSSGLNVHGQPFIVMEFLEGISLAQKLKAGRLNTQSFFACITQVLSGLEHAHKSQIVHRDIKPSNIMLCRDSEGHETYKIIDFGIARVKLSPEQAATKLTASNSILGSPTYMSPEQCRGQRGNHLSDIYSLGCLMYECISGAPPLLGDNALETMYMHINVPPPSLSSRARSPEAKQLGTLVDRCLEKAPEARPQSVSQIAGEMAALVNSDIDRVDPFSARHISLTKRSVLAGCVSILVVLLLGTNYFLNCHSQLAAVKIASNPEQGKIDQEIKRLKARTAELKKRHLSSGERSLYLERMWELARAQLQSSRPQDHAESEKTFRTCLELCNSPAHQLQGGLAASYAGLARAEWRQGKVREAAADFDTVQRLCANKEMDDCTLVDLRLEQVLYRTQVSKYAEALSEFSKVRDNFLASDKSDGWWLSFSPWAEKRGLMMSSILDCLSDGRQPRSQAEANEMIALSNTLAKVTIEFAYRRNDAKRALEFSDSLLQEFKVNDQLKAETRQLLSRCQSYDH
jgi:serine/threonine protein kinase